MDSSEFPLLAALAVFKNILNEELVRSIHVYQFEDGSEKVVEREFLFSPTSYVEMVALPLLKVSKYRASELFEGQLIGLWLCVLAFNADVPTNSAPIPLTLTISENPKLKSIPTLAKDLEKIFQWRCRAENDEVYTEVCRENNDDSSHSTRIVPMFRQDPYCTAHPVAAQEPLGSQQIDQSVPEDMMKKKKKRAATEHIASIALSDLAKYFGLPITEASRNLKVGLTVLKRKCREFGIPRWPHRKIKSLDTLIHDLQEEAEKQERENKAAAMAVMKRQRMLEREKEVIERKPFMEIQSETKRFRQDVFKRRHRARALNNNNNNLHI